MSEQLYFAYGSNMNMDQMAFRCPDASVVGVVRVDDYRLTFCGSGYAGVATILPQPGSHVDGVLWRISAADEKHLDFYEGYPRLYGKEPVEVIDSSGQRMTVMAYDPAANILTVLEQGGPNDYMQFKGTPEEIAQTFHFSGKLKKVFFDLRYRNISHGSRFVKEKRERVPPKERNGDGR